MIRSLPLAVLTHPVNARARENFTRKLGHLLLGARAPSPAALANHLFERNAFALRAQCAGRPRSQHKVVSQTQTDPPPPVSIARPIQRHRSMIRGQLIVDLKIIGVTISGRKMGQVKQAANSQGAIFND